MLDSIVIQDSGPLSIVGMFTLLTEENATEVKKIFDEWEGRFIRFGKYLFEQNDQKKWEIAGYNRYDPESWSHHQIQGCEIRDSPNGRIVDVNLRKPNITYYQIFEPTKMLSQWGLYYDTDNFLIGKYDENDAIAFANLYSKEGTKSEKDSLRLTIFKFG